MKPLSQSEEAALLVALLEPLVREEAQRLEAVSSGRFTLPAGRIALQFAASLIAAGATLDAARAAPLDVERLRAVLDAHHRLVEGHPDEACGDGECAAAIAAEYDRLASAEPPT